MPAPGRDGWARPSATPCSSPSAASSPSPPARTCTCRRRRRSRAPTSSGRGEARSGRSVEALLAAYRIGARVAWRDMSQVAVDAGVDAEQLGRFAELVFAYIDELSAASVAGHTDELQSSGRVRQRNLERLARALLTGAPADAVAAAAERADWEPPGALTAVVLPESQVSQALTALDAHTLQATDDVPGLPEGHAAAARAERGDGGSPSYVAASPARHRCGRRPGGAVARGACLAPPRDPLPPRWGSRASSTPRTTSPRCCWPPTATRVPTCGRAYSPRWPTSGPRPPRSSTETLRVWLLHHGRRDGDRRGALRPPADRALPRRAAAGGLRRPARGPAFVLEATLALA